MNERRPTVTGPDTDGFVAEALDFERLMAQVASSFIDLPIGRIDEAIDNALRRIVAAFNVDRSTLSSVDVRTGQFHSGHSFAAPGFLPVPKTVSSRTYPWALTRYRAGLPVVFSRLAELPPEAADDAASYASIGVRSHVGMPVLVSREFVAVLGIAAMERERAWTDDLVARMRLLADIFGSALARRRAQDRIDELLRFERLLADLATALAGSPGTIPDVEIRSGLQAVAAFLGVDCVRLWNRDPGPARMVLTHQWIAGGATTLPPELDAGTFPWLLGKIIGDNVVSAARVEDLPAEARVDAATLRASGVQSVLAIPLRSEVAVTGALLFACVREERLWPDEIVPRLKLFGKMLMGALARRMAEESARQATIEAAQSRERLAHLARVDAVGVMSAAIAHEVNQPLMAIENYAHAGRRRLSGADAIDRARLGELFEKIGGQASLASSVLDGLRTMVKRREAQEARIDLARVIGNVLSLVEMEGRLNDVRVESVVVPELPPVLGDGIQIQQVILNLAHNAMEAMVAVPAAARVLRLEAHASGSDPLLIRVADRGPGIASADEESVFEPFRTTKENGLGIGLSICRTIVEAHGGKLWHVPNPGGGTVFQFTLPRAEEGA